MSQPDPVIPNQIVYIAAGASFVVACVWGLAFLTQPKPVLRSNSESVKPSQSMIAPLCLDDKGDPIDCNAQKDLAATQMQANAKRDMEYQTMDSGCLAHPKGFWRYADGTISEQYDEKRANVDKFSGGKGGFGGGPVRVECPKR